MLNKKVMTAVITFLGKLAVSFRKNEDKKVNVDNGMNVYVGWDQWISKQKNRFKRYLEWTRCKRQTMIHSCDLNEDNLRNKGNLSYPRLVFSMEPGQTFWIGDDIQIVLLASHDGIVRLAIEAPPGLKIARERFRNEGAAGD